MSFLIRAISLIIVLMTIALSTAAVDASQLAQAIFDETNRARQENGLFALETDPKLSVVAQAHSDDMIARHFKDHINPDGEGPVIRVKRLYPELLGDIGENLFGLEIVGGKLDGIPSLAKETVGEWLESPEHRANLLNATFTNMAVAVAKQGESFVATQLFCREYIILDKPLPASAAQNAVLEIDGRVGAGWNPVDLEVFLVLPDPGTEVQIAADRVSVGVAPQHPQVNGNDFTVLIVFNYGKGVYRIGFGHKGKVYYPFGNIVVK